MRRVPRPWRRPSTAKEFDLRTGVRIERAAHDRNGWTLFLHDGEELRADAVLVAAGREPVFDAHDLDAAGVELDDRAARSSPRPSAPPARTSGRPAMRRASCCSPTWGRTKPTSSSTTWWANLVHATIAWFLG